MTRTVHVVEPGGWGGVYQHAAAVAAFLAGAGVTVVLHTAGDAEDVPLPPAVSRRTCFWRFADLRSRPLRRCAVVAGWLLAGVPRCLTRMRPGDVVHIEGRFLPLLLLPLFVGARLRRCTVAFSPHNTFSRRAGCRVGPAEEWLVRWLARRADVVFAFSDHDRSVIEGWGARVARVPLAIGAWALTADPEHVTAWRRRWGATGDDVERPVVLFAGQIRHDKGLDLAVVAAAQWGPDALLAVVGEDHGGLAGALRAGSMLGVDVVVDEGYQPLPQLVAALAAADVVICPYRVASMSAVLAITAALGRPTVATDVGGLAEVATVVVPPGDPGALAAGVDKALASDPLPPSWPDPRQFAAAYLSAYGTTGAD